ncbi:MAG TPA: hypothetical protein VNN25_28125 [Thermoanaerobaculia bacterium]|nr:hypothetical protein [Thermoanaerobaculia bacterium]
MTTIVTDTGTFRVVPDLPLDRVAVFVARLVDEVSGAEPRSLVGIQTNREAAYAREASGGMLAVSGRVEHLFPELATKAYSLDLTIDGPGYRPVKRTDNISIGSLFPIDLGTIPLRPYPIRVEGRVTQDSNRNPIAGASVSVITPKLALLRVPAYRDHPAGTNVTVQTLTPGSTRSLGAGAPAGTLTFLLSSVASLAANGVLLFGDSEYGIIDSIDSPAKTVTLKHALQRSYAINATVKPVTTAAGAATTTARDVNAGDGILILSATLTGNAVDIGGAEYHDLGVLSDAGGFYAANGVGGVRELTFRASAGGFIDLDVPLTIDYASPNNPLTFKLRT